MTTPTLLVVCPTRNRPERCREMLESFKRTVSRRETVMVCYVDQLDPQQEAYEKIFDDTCVRHRFGPRLSVPAVYNRFFSPPPEDWGHFQETDYKYFSDANDDFIYHTPGWDEKLISVIEQNGGLGMAFGQTKNLPTAAVWSARSLRALGWWMPPGFIHQYVDNIHRDLFSMAGQMYSVPDVNTEHRHACFGAVPWDEGYNQIYKSPDAVKDAEAYEVWRRTRMMDDLRKLKDAK
jgi:hypothetical protein